jgi:alpha-N-arabinofuranosidase
MERDSVTDGGCVTVTEIAGSVQRGDVVGSIDRRLFGTFVEHLGRCVYTGIYEPSHPAADERGFRSDVMALSRELGVTIVRYPGGNFVSGYDWEDGIGPRTDRPTRLDLAWRSIETNEFGTDEFMDWVGAIGAEPMLAVNLGTRGIDAARRLVEYCNHPGRTALSDLRQQNGHAAPHGVKLWCLGNEMDGPWQIGQKSAHEYGVLARETAKAMKLVDPTIEVVACGSSSSSMPTFGTWEEGVLNECYEYADYLSLHAYYEEQDGDLDSFLASSVDMDTFIDKVTATADRIGTRLGSGREINLSFDEWNVWYLSRMNQSPGRWQEHPRLAEDAYTLVDAVVVGNLLITLLQHADRVRIACLAQLVNALAPIMTEPGGAAWRQTTFFPFALTSSVAKSGESLRVHLDSPEMPTERYGDVPVLDAAAVYHEADGGLSILCVNRDRHRSAELMVTLDGFDGLVVDEHIAMTGPDPNAKNTQELPDSVAPQVLSASGVEGRSLRSTLPAMSWNAIRLSRAGASG